MKKIIFTIVLLLSLQTIMTAQSSFSLGFGGSRIIKYYTPIPSFSCKNVGLVYQYDLSSRFALEYELRYSRPKFKYLDIFNCAGCLDVIETGTELNKEVKFNKINTNIALNYKILEHKWFQWRVATGPNINYYNGLQEGQYYNFDLLIDKVNLSFVGKNYFNVKLSQHYDLQFITLLNIGKSDIFDTNIIQFNTAIRYKL